MDAAKPLTADTLICDRDVLRFDWEGFPRFYVVRLYEHEHGRKVYVELECDPSAHFDKVTEDDPDCINEATLDCIAEIEWQCEGEWERELYEQRLDCLTAYEKSFGY